jgi:hypothetical protein
MSMLRKLIVCSIISFAAITCLQAQAAYEPEKGSPERKAILDALRIPVERDLKQRVVFNTDNFKVSGNWAFVSGSPQTPDGGRPDYSRSKYRTAVDSGAFDDNFFALVKRTAGKWKTVAVEIGCTDVCFMDWPQKYRAPKAIFPFGE